MATWPGTYDSPTMEAYLKLLDYEAFTLQMAEIHKRNGFLGEAKAVLRDRNGIRIKRICMKAALRQKEKADRAATQSATKDNILTRSV